MAEPSVGLLEAVGSAVGVGASAAFAAWKAARRRNSPSDSDGPLGLARELRDLADELRQHVSEGEQKWERFVTLEATTGSLPKRIDALTLEVSGLAASVNRLVGRFDRNGSGNGSVR